MVYISIPYVSENKRISKSLVKNELDILGISVDEKFSVYKAIYNLKPRGVDFEGPDTVATDALQSTLRELGIPYRRLEESDY
jgi:hypothetical protein